MTRFTCFFLFLFAGCGVSETTAESPTKPVPVDTTTEQEAFYPVPAKVRPKSVRVDEGVRFEETAGGVVQGQTEVEVAGPSDEAVSKISTLLAASVLSPAPCETITETGQATFALSPPMAAASSLRLDVAPTSGCGQAATVAPTSVTLDPSTTSHVFSGLSEETWYEWTLVMVDAAGSNVAKVGYFRTSACGCTEEADGELAYCQADGSCVCEPLTCQSQDVCGTLYPGHPYIDKDGCGEWIPLDANCRPCEGTAFDWAAWTSFDLALDPASWIYGTDTLTDPRTGLMWTTDVFNVEQAYLAEAFCEGLTVGGYTDWTAPRITQLVSLLDFEDDGLNQHLDPWAPVTTNRDPQIGTKFQLATRWLLPNHAVNSGGGFLLRCVRLTAGAQTPTVPPARYTLTANTVYDVDTQLMWERSHTPATSIAAAMSVCANSTTGGHTDWRLPNIKELVSLVDWSQTSPNASIDPVAFPNTPLASFWSDSPNQSSPGDPYYWAVMFEGGSITYYGSHQQVRCVR